MYSSYWFHYIKCVCFFFVQDSDQNTYCSGRELRGKLICGVLTSGKSFCLKFLMLIRCVFFFFANVFGNIITRYFVLFINRYANMLL